VLLSCTGVILLTFVIVSLFDVVLAVLYARFYSNASFVVTFGADGIFAGVTGYMNSIVQAPVKNEQARWGLIILIILFGLLFVLLLAKLEGGKYEAAFKVFGFTPAASSLLFVKGKPD
jgi:hypothetical protein